MNTKRGKRRQTGSEHHRKTDVGSTKSQNYICLGARSYDQIMWPPFEMRSIVSRGDRMHVCECCALALIIFALSFCSLSVCVSKVNGSFLGYIQIADVSQPRYRFIHLPLLHLFACCCCRY